MKNEFNNGDPVKLKSGGPEMTVQSILGKSEVNFNAFINDHSLVLSGRYQNGDLVCQWFHNGKLNDGIFPPESLDKLR